MNKPRKYPKKYQAKNAPRAVFALACALLASAGLYLWMLGSTTPPAPAIGWPPSLQASDGRMVSPQDFRGRLVLVYFGYTECRDVCPATLTAIRDALDRLKERGDQVQPIFITVDPDHDTPQHLRTYLGSFSPRILGLTGTMTQIQAAERVYGIEVSHAPGMEIDHSSVYYLIGRDGRLLNTIPGDDDGSALAAEIARYVVDQRR